MSTLHITNGSCAGDTLQTFADGPVVLACDVLHGGPAPRVDDETWYRTRAEFLCAADRSDFETIREGLAAADRAIRDAVVRGDEVVLWFEHDLFDQLELIRTLDVVGRVDAGIGARAARRVSLICIDRFPGVDRFVGLGQLNAEQLASLYPSRQRVTDEQLAIASAAWDAFRSPDPRALVDAAIRSTTDAAARDTLPFLGDALFRFLEEYPSTESGLTRTETLSLRALEAGPLRGDALFMVTQRAEPRPFIGDATFLEVVVALANARVPLVSMGCPGDKTGLRQHTIVLLDAGRDVLGGRSDHMTLNGIDTWRGGVHLTGADRSPWRWDARRKRLVS